MGSSMTTHFDTGKRFFYRLFSGAVSSSASPLERSESDTQMSSATGTRSHPLNINNLLADRHRNLSLFASSTVSIEPGRHMAGSTYSSLLA
jgi:hypothetical protein